LPTEKVRRNAGDAWPDLTMHLTSMLRSTYESIEEAGRWLFREDALRRALFKPLLVAARRPPRKRPTKETPSGPT
jgi:hypothetical protein